MSYGVGRFGHGRCVSQHTRRSEVAPPLPHLFRAVNFGEVGMRDDDNMITVTANIKRNGDVTFTLTSSEECRNSGVIELMTVGMLVEVQRMLLGSRKIGKRIITSPSRGR